jgi:hypothetical protein
LDNNYSWFKYGKNALAGCGTQTAALAFGGYTPPDTAATEEYNGSTWTTNPTGLNTARGLFSRSGTQTCSFSFWWCSNNKIYSSNRRI